jgi:hypothetical protein
MKPGYYLIKHEGYLLPARWDGEFWRHERGVYKDHETIKDKDGNPVIIPLSCPTGCTCHTNPDGSITTNCT